jgi:hypothetical protein
MEEDAGKKKQNRQQDGRNAQRVACPVYWVLVAGRIFLYPPLVAAIAQHGELMILRPVV